jgi:hypothetical protein
VWIKTQQVVIEKSRNLEELFQTILQMDIPRKVSGFSSLVIHLLVDVKSME